MDTSKLKYMHLEQRSRASLHIIIWTKLHTFLNHKRHNFYHNLAIVSLTIYCYIFITENAFSLVDCRSCDTSDVASQVHGKGTASSHQIGLSQAVTSFISQPHVVTCFALRGWWQSECTLPIVLMALGQ